MAEEPSLPALPTVTLDEQPHTFSKGCRKRLRPVHANTGTTAPGLYNSSDPAVFSSDDDPSLDNYVSGRRKRKYIGSWYQQFPTSSDSAYSDPPQPLPRAKRTFRRQLDSGVFLGSDGTDNESLPETIELPIHSKLPRLEKPPVPIFSEAERQAQERVRDCLEQGNESIDFWSMGLEDISNETIAPLAQLSCIPLVSRDVAFEQRDPELKIYLAGNKLFRLPGTLFDLTFLTVLSLRDNKLSELPTSISKLTNLRELNLALNKLRHLPPQLLSLTGPNGGLKKLMLFPNPFIQPGQAIGSMSANSDKNFAQDYIVSAPIGAKRPAILHRFQGQTPLQLSSSRGRVTSKFSLSFETDTLPLEFTRDGLENEGNEVTLRGCDDSLAVKPSIAPSLVEAALRSCHRITKPEALIPYIPDELQQLQTLLGRVAFQKQSGGLFCSRCQKLMVMPAVSWVEWRELRTCYWLQAGNRSMQNVGSDRMLARLIPLSTAADETVVPFLHRACSWQCGPMEKKANLQWGRGFDIEMVEQ